MIESGIQAEIGLILLLLVGADFGCLALGSNCFVTMGHVLPIFYSR